MNELALPPTPELAKQLSTRPKVSRVAANADSTCSSSPTSHTNAAAFAPSASIVATAAVFLEAFVPQIAIDAPAFASPSAIPSPMPELPPVMSATWPVRSKRFSGMRGNVAKAPDRNRFGR